MASTSVISMAAQNAGDKLSKFTYELPELESEQVEINVESCGICHSDLSMLNNEWRMTQYPFVPGHEVIGTISAIGSQVKNLKVGQKVGLGWFSGSCMACHSCLNGDHNLCGTAEQTIVGRYGGFATKVRSHWGWALPLPANIDHKTAGPLFCGGITVFNPLVQFNIKPTDKVAVLGIGGLGHLAIQFLNKWGCEVTAFTSKLDKEAEIKSLGAHYVYSSRDANLAEALTSYFDFVLNTANADLDWSSYFELLAPRGRLHSVGAVPGPISLSVFSLIPKQTSLSGSPLGSPAVTQKMLDFVTRHNIQVKTEHFPMSQAQEALDYLQNGQPNFRIVLDNDL